MSELDRTSGVLFGLIQELLQIDDADIVQLMDALDDYVDARIDERLDREFNRGAWARDE